MSEEAKKGSNTTPKQTMRCPRDGEPMKCWEQRVKAYMKKVNKHFKRKPQDATTTS